MCLKATLFCHDQQGHFQKEKENNFLLDHLIKQFPDKFMVSSH